MVWTTTFGVPIIIEACFNIAIYFFENTIWITPTNFRLIDVKIEEQAARVYMQQLALRTCIWTSGECILEQLDRPENSSLLRSLHHRAALLRCANTCQCFRCSLHVSLFSMSTGVLLWRPLSASSNRSKGKLYEMK